MDHLMAGVGCMKFLNKIKCVFNSAEQQSNTSSVHSCCHATLHHTDLNTVT